uniref:Uncharacterized protein n=1 Tax=Megaviridae environmental sample TaxID=1737588 RepID=A0A5J6VJX5_9VIRU|nr:MAG: hypothetical protein [Megaviridae environmental sample]
MRSAPCLGRSNAAVRCNRPNDISFSWLSLSLRKQDLHRGHAAGTRPGTGRTRAVVHPARGRQGSPPSPPRGGRARARRQLPGVGGGLALRSGPAARCIRPGADAREVDGHPPGPQSDRPAAAGQGPLADAGRNPLLCPHERRVDPDEGSPQAAHRGAGGDADPAATRAGTRSRAGTRAGDHIADPGDRCAAPVDARRRGEASERHADMPVERHLPHPDRRAGAEVDAPRGPTPAPGTGTGTGTGTRPGTGPGRARTVLTPQGAHTRDASISVRSRLS